MEVQHTRSGDTGAESVVYTFLLNRGCSEERHYGMESVKSKSVLLKVVMKMVTELVFALLGLRAAEMTALPSNIIREAKTIASKVNQQLLVWFIKIRFCLLVLYTF